MNKAPCYIATVYEDMICTKPVHFALFDTYDGAEKWIKAQQEKYGKEALPSSTIGSFRHGTEEKE